MSEPVLVALTGAPGSGKSTVAELLRQHGFPVLDADSIARDLMENDPTLRRQLEERFGSDIFTADGRLRRAELAKRIFGQSPEHRAARRYVEELVHPRVLEALAQKIRDLAASGERVIVVEAALIYEAGIADAFDYVVLVDADDALRHRRLQERGWSVEDIHAREAAQLSPRTKRQRADIVLDNNGSREQLQHSVSVLAEVLRLLPSRLPPSGNASLYFRDDTPDRNHAG